MSDFRNPKTWIAYLVRINETTLVELPPAEIVRLIEDGYELSITITRR